MLRLRDYFINRYGAVLGVYYWNIVFDFWYTEDKQVINKFGIKFK